ncbi:MAG TPA: zf-HC2 domain-containing protein [Rhizomicrobium sp.]
MNCPELLRTQAFLDGELTGDAAREAERHIAGCEDCRASSASVAEMSDVLRASTMRHRAPQALRDRIGALLDKETAPVERVPRRRRREFWTGALSGVGTAALAAALTMFVLLPPSAETLAQSVADAHTHALMSGKVIEVASSSHHTVKPWFAGKVEVSPPVADFAQEGFPLVGGRVDKVAGSRAAVVVYHHGRHEIDLFVWPDKGARLPGESTRYGYHAIFWKSGDLNFAAVCDMEGAELHKFVNLVRAESE